MTCNNTVTSLSGEVTVLCPQFRASFNRGYCEMSMLKHAAAAVLLASLSMAGCAGSSEPTHNKAGFVTEVKEGRLWVFKSGAKEYQEYQKNGELAKVVTRIGEGPNGMTLKAPDAATLDAYLAAK